MVSGSPGTGCINASRVVEKGQGTQEKVRLGVQGKKFFKDYFLLEPTHIVGGVVAEVCESVSPSCVSCCMRMLAAKGSMQT